MSNFTLKNKAVKHCSGEQFYLNGRLNNIHSWKWTKSQKIDEKSFTIHSDDGRIRDP